LNKLDSDFRSQIAGIPGATAPTCEDLERRSNCSSTRSSAIMRRHSADADVAKNSLENRLAVGMQSKKDYDHMRSQFGGLNFASPQRQEQPVAAAVERNFHSLLRQSQNHIGRGRSESMHFDRRNEGFFPSSEQQNG
jgi:hypothetical protein